MKKEKQNNRRSPTPHAKAPRTSRKQEKKFDPLGSYTGRCENKQEVPTQDADDL